MGARYMDTAESGREKKGCRDGEINKKDVVNVMTKNCLFERAREGGTRDRARETTSQITTINHEACSSIPRCNDDTSFVKLYHPRQIRLY